MASVSQIGENHWRVFMAATDKCDLVIEVRMPREQADQLVKAMANDGILSGLDAPDPPFPLAVMMKLMS